MGARPSSGHPAAASTAGRGGAARSLQGHPGTAGEAISGNVATDAAGEATAPGGEEVSSHSVTVSVTTPGGEAVRIQIAAEASVARLKELVQAQTGVAGYRQKLVLGTVLLQDRCRLAEQGVEDGCLLTLVKGPPVPDWCAGVGLDGEHPARLRAYHAQHGLEQPEWLQADEQCWEKLEAELQARERNRANLRGWGSHIQLLGDDGAPSATLRAGPGQQVRATVKGWIYNNHGDTCIHQLVLACDAEVVAEISNHVPRRGSDLNKKIRFEAPREAGAYMLWRYADLQYSMRDARRNFQTRHGTVQAGKYPQSFVGWLVVE